MGWILLCKCIYNCSRPYVRFVNCLGSSEVWFPHGNQAARHGDSAKKRHRKLWTLGAFFPHVLWPLGQKGYGSKWLSKSKSDGFQSKKSDFLFGLQLREISKKKVIWKKWTKIWSTRIFSSPLVWSLSFSPCHPRNSNPNCARLKLQGAWELWIFAPGTSWDVGWGRWSSGVLSPNFHGLWWRFP